MGDAAIVVGYCVGLQVNGAAVIVDGGLIFAEIQVGVAAQEIGVPVAGRFAQPFAQVLNDLHLGSPGHSCGSGAARVCIPRNSLPDS